MVSWTHIYQHTFNTQILQTDLIVGSKFTIFALFYFVFEGNFPSTNPWGAYIWRGDLTEGFLSYQFKGLIIWRGLYMGGLTFGILRYLDKDGNEVRWNQTNATTIPR